MIEKEVVDTQKESVIEELFSGSEFEILINNELNVSPPELSSHYYKSRNNLLLYSALLFFWGLLDISINKEIDFNNAGIVINIGNIEAFSVILFILVVYFTYRFLVEWFQSDLRRRLMSQSKIDLSVSLLISIISMIAYFGQKLRGDSIYVSFSFYMILLMTIPTCYFIYLQFISGRELKASKTICENYKKQLKKKFEHISQNNQLDLDGKKNKVKELFKQTLIEINNRKISPYYQALNKEELLYWLKENKEELFYWLNDNNERTIYPTLDSI